MVSGIHFVPTPATADFMAAVQRGQWDTALRIAEEHWTEIWFGVDPADLRHILSQAPPEVMAESRNAAFLARVAGHGEPDDLLQPERPPADRRDLAALARVVSDLRLRGRPVRAMTYARRAEDQMRAQRGRLMDGSGGLGALSLVQVAITALLANDAPAAQGMLLAATNTHRADRYPFVIREAKAKLALTYAATGNLVEATAWATRAHALPRGASWVEALIDDTLWLADYLCAVEALDPRAEELRLAKPSPLQHREFWPLALTAHVRHLTSTGRYSQARDLCAAVAATGLPLPDSDGAFATVLSDANLVIDAHEGRSTHQSTAPSAQSQLSQALHLLRTGQYPRVLRITEEDLPPSYDGRVRHSLRLLRAQALDAIDPQADAQPVIDAVAQILDNRHLTSLRFLTDETLSRIADSAAGADAAQVLRTHQLPTVTGHTILTAPLSKAEVEAMRLLKQGLSRKEIAEQLVVSVNTIKSQLGSVYRKLGATDRSEALAKFSAARL